jgi:hypothetical protein
VEDRQILDLAPAVALTRLRVHRFLWVEAIGAQPVDAARIGGAEALGVLDRQEALADAPKPGELNDDAGVLVLREAHRVERGVDAPELLQPTDKPR